MRVQYDGAETESQYDDCRIRESNAGAQCQVCWGKAGDQMGWGRQMSAGISTNLKPARRRCHSLRRRR